MKVVIANISFLSVKIEVERQWIIFIILYSSLSLKNPLIFYV